jgi:hypothetical protein
MLGRMGSVMVASALLSARVALGCEPSLFEPPPICERFWEEDAVALVDVQNIEIHGQDRWVTLRVVDVYRGSPPAELTMRDPITTCGPNFGRKSRYLAWFSKTKSGKWKAYGESAETASEDLKYAQTIKNQPNVGRIHGTLDKPRRSRFMTVSRESEPGPSRAGVVVVAENESARFNAAVGTDLSFEFSRLPPGKYRIRVEGLPSNLTVDSEEVEVHGGGCNELALFSASSAGMVGRLVAAGRMPRFAQVFLISTANLGKSEPSSLPWVMTDGSSGAFQFKHVEPGKYVLGFELGHSPTLDVPYASRYYPEGRETTEATVIEVHAGERIGNIEFNVGGEVARRRVRVRVTWANGSPAINATAYLRDAHNPYSSVADEQTLTDANGEALLEGFVDTDYDVAANAVCKGRSISNAVETKVISASAGDAFVRLTVKGRKCPLADWRHTEEDQ